MASQEHSARRKNVHETIAHIERRVEERRVGYSEVPHRRAQELPTMRVDRKSQQLADRLALLLDQCVASRSAAPLGKW